MHKECDCGRGRSNVQKTNLISNSFPHNQNLGYNIVPPLLSHFFLHPSSPATRHPFTAWRYLFCSSLLLTPLTVHYFLHEFTRLTTKLYPQLILWFRYLEFSKSYLFMEILPHIPAFNHTSHISTYPHIRLDIITGGMNDPGDRGPSLLDTFPRGDIDSINDDDGIEMGFFPNWLILMDILFFFMDIGVGRYGKKKRK